MAEAEPGLPNVFRYRDARDGGVSDRQLRHMRESGQVERVARGVYRRADAARLVDVDLLEIAARSSRATLCLVTALARHGLTVQVPARIDVALPRGERARVVTAPVSWHWFASDTFDLGRESVDIGEGVSIGLYSPERCIVDMFRLRHREGADVAVEALKAWLRVPGSQPGRLLALAGAFPHTVTSLRTTLEVLL